MKMPFGKYKGQEIETLSYGYCSTLLDNVPIKDTELKKALLKQRDKRYLELQRDAYVYPDDTMDGYGFDWDLTNDLDFGDLC